MDRFDAWGNAVPVDAGTPQRRLALTRHFSIASLIGLIAVTAALVAILGAITERHLIAHETRANTDLARAFANAVWREYRGFVQASRGATREALVADPAALALGGEVRRFMKGLSIVKVKIYNTDGLTVYSTDRGQVGEDKSGNEGFRRAIEGESASQITYRDRFDAFEGSLSNRNLIATYIPVRPAAGVAPEGVLEVYSDVTELLARQREARWQVAGIVVGVLALLYAFLLALVRRADRTIRSHEAARERQESEVRHRALHDALTGLPNRAAFGERLADVLAEPAPTERVGALLFIDLDRFKVVNDSLGHAAGDRLLCAVSERIRARLRPDDLLFRMGGDEFTVIVRHVAEPQDAAHVAERIQRALAAPIPVHGHEVSVGATVGIALFPVDGSDADTLVRNADAAMYAAKRVDPGGHAFYRAWMNEHALGRLANETAVQRAFRDGQFVLHYQPLFDASSRRPVGAEALLRWNHPTRGLVAPAEFIPILEETGLMPEVGEWVLRVACEQLRRWHDGGHAALRVSVNISARQFVADGFVATVRRVLEASGVPASAVELELSETMLLTDIAHSAAIVAGLRALGVRLSIDDFGAGYSSLAYLRNLQVDTLKLDRSITSEVGGSARERAIAEAIVGLARSIGMTTVAEGVETEAQAAFYGAIGCTELQGYLLARPAAAAALPFAAFPATGGEPPADRAPLAAMPA